MGRFERRETVSGFGIPGASHHQRRGRDLLRGRSEGFGLRPRTSRRARAQYLRRMVHGPRFLGEIRFHGPVGRGYRGLRAFLPRDPHRDLQGGRGGRRRRRDLRLRRGGRRPRRVHQDRLHRRGMGFGKRRPGRGQIHDRRASVTFETDHNSVYVVASEAPSDSEAPSKDDDSDTLLFGLAVAGAVVAMLVGLYLNRRRLKQ